MRVWLAMARPSQRTTFSPGMILSAHFRDDQAIHLDPAQPDQFLGLASRGNAALRQIFLQSNRIVHRHLPGTILAIFASTSSFVAGSTSRTSVYQGFIRQSMTMGGCSPTWKRRTAVAAAWMSAAGSKRVKNVQRNSCIEQVASAVLSTRRTTGQSCRSGQPAIPAASCGLAG